MAFRMYHRVSRADLLHLSATVAISLISIFSKRSRTYLSWRNLLAVALRLGVVTCGLIAKHAEDVLQVGFATAAYQIHADVGADVAFGIPSPHAHARLCGRRRILPSRLGHW